MSDFVAFKVFILANNSRASRFNNSSAFCSPILGSSINLCKDSAYSLEKFVLFEIEDALLKKLLKLLAEPSVLLKDSVLLLNCSLACSNCFMCM